MLGYTVLLPSDVRPLAGMMCAEDCSDLWPQVTELMLCCKESNKKTRVAAYELLVQVRGMRGWGLWRAG